MTGADAEAGGSLVVRRLRDMAELPRWTTEHVQNLWDLATAGADLAVDDEAEALAQLDHPEFALLWELADDLPQPFEVEGTNPRLHVLLQGVLEAQLLMGDPPEAAAALAHLLALGFERHQAVHVILNGLIAGLHSGLTQRAPIDPKYRVYLERLMRLRPEDLADDSGRARWRAVGRNDPCPCGSGQKFKRCCGGPDAPELELLTRLRTTPIAGNTELLMDQLVAVAGALDLAGATASAAEAYRRLVQVAAENESEDSLRWALQEQLSFMLGEPEYAREGIAVVERLLPLTRNPEEIAQARLDLADLYDAAGDPARAEALFREVMAGDPTDPICHLRWARRLAEAGDPTAAEAAYRKVIARHGKVDPEAYLEACLELADLLAAAGRELEARSLRRDARGRR